MNGRLAALSFAALIVLSGCVTSARDPLAARRHEYKRLLSFIEPSMTRRQLYALLPPCRTPGAKPPSLFSIISFVQYSPHTEQHLLDRDFSLYVQYRLANLKEYPLPPFAPGRRNNPTIDDIIFGGTQLMATPSPPSRQNPNDELICRPTLMGAGIRAFIDLNTTDFTGLEVPKTSNLKRK